MEISSFHKGVTDKYLDGDPASAKKVDNLLIDENGKLIQRPGITIYNSSAPQIPAGNQRIDSLYYFDSTLFVKSGTALYYIEDGQTSWTTLLGPSSGTAFTDSEVGAKASWSEWKGHLFITPGPSTNIKTGCRTVKVYRNHSNTWTLCQAGMPGVTTKGTFGATAFVGLSETVGGQNFRYVHYAVFVRCYVAKVNGVNTVFRDYGGSPLIEEQEGDRFEGGSQTTTLGNFTFSNKTGENYDTSNWYIFLYRTKADQNEAYLSQVIALNAALTDNRDDDDLATCEEAFSATANGTAGGVLTFSTKDATFFYVDQKVSLLDNDTASATYYVTAVNYANGQVTFSATRGGSAASLTALTTAQSARALLQIAEPLYPGATDGFFNDEVLPCYFSGVRDSYGWYAGVSELRNGIRATRIIQSKPGDIDTCPGSNYVDVAGDKLTAWSFAGQHPVAFIRNKCFRLEGRFDAFGGGSIRAVLISDIEGSVSQDVIQTPDGILFPSENGWCFTDGFKAQNLSKVHLKDTYANLSTKSRMSGAFDSKNGRAYFGVESTSLVSGVTAKNNAAFVLDLLKTQGAEGVFTTMSAGANFQPNALHYDSVNGRLLIGDQRGYVFKLDSSITVDPVVNTAAAWSTWAKAAVVYDYITCAFSFGSSRIAKWMGEVTIVAKNLTGALSIDLGSYKDDRSSGRSMKAVRERGITSGLHKIFRRFPKGNLSCLYAQLLIKKGFVVIVRSDDYALATFSGAGNTALLASGSWPNDGTENLVGHYLYPEIAGAYDTGWEITIQSGNTLTVSDPGNTLPSGSGMKWVVKGYPKSENLKLHSLTIDATTLGEGYPERSDQGGNA